jgi:hypothetical protein
LQVLLSHDRNVSPPQRLDTHSLRGAAKSLQS